MGMAKQQSDLKHSFSQIYQIDQSFFIDCSEQSERVQKEHSPKVNSWELLRQNFYRPDALPIDQPTAPKQ